jgi:hypothetical protein
MFATRQLPTLGAPKFETTFYPRFQGTPLSFISRVFSLVYFHGALIILYVITSDDILQHGC